MVTNIQSPSTEEMETNIKVTQGAQHGGKSRFVLLVLHHQVHLGGAVLVMLIRLRVMKLLVWLP